MKSVPNAGGPFLVTNMKRDRSIFELDEEVKEAVEDGINAEGSNLSGVSAKCSFKPKISYEYVIDTKDEYDNSDDDEDGSGSTSDNDEEDDSEPFGSSGEATEESGAEDESNGSTQNCGNKENNSADLNQAMASKTTADANTATNDVSEVNTLNEAISHIKLNETSSGGATSATEMESEVPHRSCSQNQTNRDASQARSSSRCTSTLNANQRTLMSPCKSEASSSMSVSHEPQTHGHSLSRMSYTSETGAMEPNDFLLPRFFKQVHITINLEAGLLLPLALR